MIKSASLEEITRTYHVIYVDKDDKEYSVNIEVRFIKNTKEREIDILSVMTGKDSYIENPVLDSKIKEEFTEFFNKLNYVESNVVLDD